MKILVNCYACSPYQGSEPGMGWNFVKCLSGLHELHIITECKYRGDLEKYFEEHPDEKRRYHFYYVKRERHNLLRKIWPPSYYWFYKKWQKKVLRLAKALDAKENFDIVHQLNMVGYREPGYLWTMDKPFVWGPMGGFNITPWRLLPTMGPKGCLFYAARNMINLYQMRFSARVNKAVRRSDSIICATLDDALAVKRLWKKDCTIIPEVGFTTLDKDMVPLKRDGKMKICWSGLHIPRKSLNLLLEAIAQCRHKDEIELHVIGDGECNRRWKSMARRLRLNQVHWHGWIARHEALNIMQASHLFAITSLSDATSTVLLEALSCGLPVLTLNHLGFANVVNDNCGIKIDIHSKRQVLNDIATAIDNVCESESTRLSLAANAIRRAKEFSWNNKAMAIDNIYKSLLN